MAKKIKDDFNVNSNLRYEFQRAVLIADDLKVDEINTVSLILAMLKDEFSVLNRIFMENRILVKIDSFIYQLFSSKKFYEDIVGEEFPYENKEESTSSIEKKIEEAIRNNNEELNLSEAEIKQNVKNILTQFEVVMEQEIPEYVYDIPYSKNLKQALFDAGNRARVNGKNYIDEENLLYSILSLPNCSGKRLLQEISAGLEKNDVLFDLVDINNELVNNYDICFSYTEGKLVIPPSLESCCSIFNDHYKKGVKCDILGRDGELEELWNYLSKKQKRNVILAGPAGVGKSAIVEALTMSIENGTCPNKFKGYKVIDFNVSGMVAGTKYRGEFEQKAENLVKFASHYDNLIIFIDEIHHLMGAGSAEGSGPDLSGRLKPILARDTVRFIGATTLEEYKKYICRDDALRRRFELVIVNEPKYGEVLPMLKAKIEKLKAYHGVTINKRTLEYIQLCAACLNNSKRNPDKTLDLIDSAMASATLAKSKIVKFEHVDRVFSKNYKEYEKNSVESNRRTAHHEAGHFVVNFLYKDVLVDEEVYALSVIPGFGFLGANILESTGIQPKGDDKYYEAEIASLLAGRIAEEIFFNEKTSGATNDLGRASCIARNMVANYGLSSDEYMNFSIYDGNSGNTLPFSEKVIDNINKEAKEIVDKVYKETKEILSKDENKAKIEVVAKTLLKKKIVSAKELEEIISRM